MVARVLEDGAYFYVHEPDGGRHCPEQARIVTASGAVLSRRRHGYSARVEVFDESGAALHVATLLRAAAAVGRAAERRGTGWARARLRPSGPESLALDPDGVACARLDGPGVARAPVHHPVDARVARLFEGPLASAPLVTPELTGGPARRVLFFESLMNSDMPHNDCELSQGVLHMASALAGSGARVVLANVKMSISGEERAVVGLESLERALGQGPIDLVCVTLLEGYFEGVVGLIAELRRLGCRAHVAVGGVMPTLTPEHVACHLPDVSFVCRGAGEYFVPRLARILGDRSSVDLALDAEQRRALLGMDGLLAVDRAGKALIAGNPAHTVEVDSLDRVPLDLSLIERRHLERGVELATSRGCIHKCSFCSILGRQSYQARSAEGVLELCQRYQARYRELFGDAIPRNAFRLHLSDDDFACDRARAVAFLGGLLETPFRLSSMQVSIADLCEREGKQLVPRLDRAMLEALRPECFADSSAGIPERDYVADHKSRAWSSYLQIGVETFSERELDRLGKGYGLAHVRAAVDALAAKRIHLDAYLILANADTAAEDLVDSLEELCRLKLRHPKYFHLRFPVVPRLVSYFSSASHRRLLRRGQGDAFAVRRHARVPGHPELDYPFVDADLPRDDWVRAVEPSVLTDEAFYTRSLENLRQRFVELAGQGPLPAARERLLRRLDDLPRRLVFQTLSERSKSPAALDTATRVLGPKQGWLEAYRRFTHEAPARLVVIPTWQCQLRCVYCYIPKQDGRVMSRDTLSRSIELLLSTDRQEAILQFFGGEALVEWQLVQHGIEHGTLRARELGKRISFIVSSNGWALDEEKLAWLRQYPVKLELSLDGTPEVQNASRPSHLPLLDSYLNGIAARARAIRESGLAHEVIMVVVPKSVVRLPESFFHVADLGFRHIQINFALGVTWRPEQQIAFAESLDAIGRELEARWARGEELSLTNLDAAPYPVRLNGEVTVDFDGTLYAGNGFLHENEHKQKLVMGHLDDRRSFDRYFLDAPGNDRLLELGYAPDVTRNNWRVGTIMASFVRHMRGRVPHAQTAPAGELAFAPPFPPG